MRARKVLTSAETILTLKNRESIHFAKFAHDTCADTFFWRIDSFYESILGKIRHISECKGCQICIMKDEKGFSSFEKWPSPAREAIFSAHNRNMTTFALWNVPKLSKNRLIEWIDSSKKCISMCIMGKLSKMNQFTVLESLNRLSTRREGEGVAYQEGGREMYLR